MAYYKIQFIVDNITWLAITPPISCSSFTLRNPPGLDVLLRTKLTDPSSEDTLWSGAQEVVIGAPKGTGFSIPNRFLAGQPILYVKVATPGLVTLICTFVE